MNDDEPTTIGNPDIAVPSTGTSGYEYPPPPPPEGYTLDQWIDERKIRADAELAKSNYEIAKEMREERRERGNRMMAEASIEPRPVADFTTPGPPVDRWFWPMIYFLAFIAGGLGALLVGGLFR